LPNNSGFSTETELLNSAVENGLGLAYDEHALKQMRERHIFRQDVLQAVATGVIEGVEIAHGNEERWRISGTNVDGFPLTVVIRAIRIGDTVIYVVTTFEPN